MQAHLIGEYALAVWDRTKDSLLLTHDAVGVQPLYHSRRGQRIYFGTHLSLLAAAIPGIGLDESYIAEYLLCGEYLGERTIYAGVLRLGVGRTMQYHRFGADELRTWWLGDIPELCYRDPRDYDEHFRQLLQAAVRTAVQGRTWSELSGGLDSSTIACTAHRLGVEDFETISTVYPASITSDERPWIKIVRTETGLRGHLVDGDKHCPFSVLANRTIDEPSRLHITWPVFQQYETILSAHGVDVLLSGLGGDQVLFGETDYPVHVADQVRRLRLISAVRQVAQWSPTAGERSLTHRVITTAVIPAVSYLGGHSVIYRHRSAGPRRCSWVCQDLVERTKADHGVVRAPTPRMPSVRGQVYFERIWRLACAAGRTWAQNTTAYRWRYPLLYRPLVEFIYSLPWQHQAISGQDRVLQRRALAGILPEQTRTWHTKAGPGQAIYERLRTNRDVYELLTDRPLIAQRGYVDRTAWRTTVRTAQFGYARPLPAFSAAVSLEIWLRHQENHL